MPEFFRKALDWFMVRALEPLLENPIMSIILTVFLAVSAFVGLRAWRRHQDSNVLKATLNELKQYDDEKEGNQSKNEELQDIVYKAKVVLDRYNIHCPEFKWDARVGNAREWKRILTICASHHPNMRNARNAVEGYLRKRYPYYYWDDIPITFATTVLLYTMWIIPGKWIRAVLFKIPFYGEGGEGIRIKWVMRTCFGEIQDIVSSVRHPEDEFTDEVGKLYPILEKCGFEMPDINYPEKVPFYKRQELHKDCVRKLTYWINIQGPYDINEVAESNKMIRMGVKSLG